MLDDARKVIYVVTLILLLRQKIPITASYSYNIHSHMCVVRMIFYFQVTKTPTRQIAPAPGSAILGAIGKSVGLNQAALHKKGL